MKKPKDKRTERIIKDCKSRGGRPTQVIKDKTKYDRTQNKDITEEELDLEDLDNLIFYGTGVSDRKDK